MKPEAGNTSMNKIIFPLIFVVFFVQGQTGGVPIRTWRTHFGYSEAKAVAVAKEKVWCGTSGGLFYLDTEDNSLHTLTKKDGISGFGVSSLAFHAASNSLIVGYEEGYIDLIINNQIYNNQDIVKSNVTGRLAINHIALYKNLGILSCDFGVVVFDINRKEIKESYLNIGTNASSPKVKASVFKGDSLFLATSNGIYKAGFGSSNLMDFANWKKIPLPDSLQNREISGIAFWDNQLYFTVNNVGIIKRNSNSWEIITTVSGVINELSVSNNELWAITSNLIYKINSQGLSLFNSRLIARAKSQFTQANGTIWLADGFYGLVKFEKESQNNFVPNGPYFNSAFGFTHYKNKIIATSGGYTGFGGGLGLFKGYYEFADNQWVNYVPGQNMPFVADLCQSAFSESRNTLYIGTQGNGVMRLNFNNGVTDFIDQSTLNCPLSQAAKDFVNIRAMDIYIDENTENLWVCNPLGSFDDLPTVHVYKANNKCNSYKFPFDAAKFPFQILVDNLDNKWVRLRVGTGGGVLVFNEKKMLDSSTPQYVYLKEGKGAGNLSANSVRCMVKDKKGDIWMGTEKGICVFNPTSDFVSKLVDAYTPIIENRPVLFDQAVSAIEIDGGNRKWVGTSNGAYLFSSDGTQVIHYFTTENSPLLSNNILAIKPDPVTGEVFFSTDKGIVSFREPASEAPIAVGEMDIFPNPVSKNFSGNIGFTKLAENAIVKIVDVSGNKVYETEAAGGTASWNGRDYNGKKINSGVYVIFSSKLDGTEPQTGKLFVIE
jgi:hypothetical protein